jgi:hypothetical protein
MKNVHEVIGRICGKKKALKVISDASSRPINSPFKSLFRFRDVFVICVGDRYSVRDLHNR